MMNQEFKDESVKELDNFLKTEVEEGSLKLTIELENSYSAPYILLGYDQTKNLIEHLKNTLEHLER